MYVCVSGCFGDFAEVWTFEWCIAEVSREECKSNSDRRERTVECEMKFVFERFQCEFASASVSV